MKEIFKKIDFGNVLIGVAFLTFIIFGAVSLYLSAQIGETLYAQKALAELIMAR